MGWAYCMRRYLTPDRAGDLGIRNGIGQGGSPWGPGHVSPIWLLPLWAPKLSSSLGSAKPGSVMSLSQFHSVARERNGDWTGLNAESPLCSAYFSAAESKPFVNRWHVRLLLIFHSHHHLMPWPSHLRFPPPNLDSFACHRRVASPICFPISSFAS